MSLTLDAGLRRRRQSPARAAHQQGVVLIIALIMLVVISMLATMSIRGATSSEAVSGNVRTTQLATQAAEVALRVCEGTLAAVAKDATVAPAGWVGALAAASPPRFKNLTGEWDINPAPDVYVVDLTNVNSALVTFRRAPECMIEQLPTVTIASPTNRVDTTTTYVITARGFGPEVANTRARPEGAEVWLQSTVQLNP